MVASENNGEQHSYNVLDPTNAYEAVNQHWIHGEYERWAIQYNFLVASTIMALAWASLFAVSNPSRQELKQTVTQTTPEFTAEASSQFTVGSFRIRLVMGALSLAGLLLSVFWTLQNCRASCFIHEYTILGEKLEKEARLEEYGPFSQAKAFRNRKELSSRTGNNVSTFMKCNLYLGKLIPSNLFVVLVSITFALLFLGAISFSIF